jgi:hypothetical protein
MCDYDDGDVDSTIYTLKKIQNIEKINNNNNNSNYFLSSLPSSYNKLLLHHIVFKLSENEN